MTAGRIVAPQARNRALGKTSRPKVRSSDDVVPGWYSSAPVSEEQVAAARGTLTRFDAVDLVPMLGLDQVPA